jgi:hypothetical protein
VSTSSLARRMRAKFVSFGFWTSILVFVTIEGDALLDQSEIGHASMLFMFGTACLAAAACIALFAIFTAIGLAASAAFKKAPRQHQPLLIEDSPVVTAAHAGPGQSQPPISLAPERSKLRRNQQSRRGRTANESRKASSRNVNR